MNLPYALRNSLRHDAFSPQETNSYYSSMTYEDNRLFNRALLLPIYKNRTFFIPILGIEPNIELLINRLQDIKQGIELEEAYVGVGLYYSNAITYKTAPAILKSINRCSLQSRLYKIDTTKGYNYYGGKGIIFDGEWHPLMIAGYHMKMDDNSIFVEDPILYVSPKVFINKDIISKFIINTIIPLYTQEGVWPASSLFSNEAIVNTITYNNVTVIVKDISNFVVTPVSPTSEDENNNIWDFLERSFQI